MLFAAFVCSEAILANALRLLLFATLCCFLQTLPICIVNPDGFFFLGGFLRQPHAAARIIFRLKQMASSYVRSTEGLSNDQTIESFIC
jgi:hypothetical protein